MKETAKYVGLTILVLLMIAAVFTYLAPHFGWRVDTLSSGSMEPQLKVGSLVVTQPVAPETVVVGDIITLRTATVAESPITHRVIGIQSNPSLHFTTKGDANSSRDPFDVPARNLVGKVCFHVPYLGYVVEFIKTPWGFVLALVIPSLTIVALYVAAILRFFTRERNMEGKAG